MDNKDNKLQDGINNFLSDEEKQKQLDQANMDCSSGVCIMKSGEELVERINKKIITEDGRQLLT